MDRPALYKIQERKENGEEGRGYKRRRQSGSSLPSVHLTVPICFCFQDINDQLQYEIVAL